MNGIILGKTYFVNGKPFIPVSKEKGKLKKVSNIWADQNARKESVYLDQNGFRVKKSRIFPTVEKSLKI